MTDAKPMTIEERAILILQTSGNSFDLKRFITEQIQQACDEARIEQLKVSQAYLETERAKARAETTLKASSCDYCYAKGFCDAREKAANTIETYRKLSLTNMLVDKDGFLIGLQSIVRALSPEEGTK